MLDAWRARAVGLMLLIVCAGTLPPLLAVLSSRLFQLPWPLRATSLLLYLAIGVAAFRPRWKRQMRTAILLVGGTVVATIQLAVTQLAGSGRLTLLSLPIVALILVGPRAGWRMAALSMTIYLAFTLLHQAGYVPPAADAGQSGHQPAFWWLQGLRLAAPMLLLLALLTRFQALQRRTMIAERMAVKRLEKETADRRRLEAEVAHVSEKERRRLGADLHDGLCQHLTAALLNATALETRLVAAAASDAAEVTKIRESLETAIDMAHDVARGLCPVDLAPEGLIPALEGLCRSVRERWGLACDLRTTGNVTVADPDRAMQVYRIAGEALTNCVRHAACTKVVVRLTRAPGELVLTVSDDGKGFGGTTGAGLGLRVMTFRAGLVGGSLTVVGEPGQGTTVTCRVPDPGGAA